MHNISDTTYALVISHDCQRAYGRTAQDSMIGWKHTSIMPTQLIERALQHLKSYCCDSNIIGQELVSCTQESLTDVYGDSQFLFDHLVDLILRRLDGKDIYGIPADPVGKERREWIDSTAENPNGIMPLIIAQKTAENRTVQPDKHIFTYNEASECISTPYTQLWDEFNRGFANEPLIHRYKNACAIAVCAYAQATLASERKPYLQEGFTRCTHMVNRRIDAEYTYTRFVSMQKSYQMLFDNMNAYMLDYFARDRLTQLHGLWFETTDIFGTVNRSIVEGTRQCSG